MIVRYQNCMEENHSLSRNMKGSNHKVHICANTLIDEDAAADAADGIKCFEINNYSTYFRGVPNLASSTLGTGGNCTSIFLFPADMAREIAELACLDI